MPRLPRITSKEMIGFLERRGFVVTRVRGSHYFLESTTHRTTVPFHGNMPLKIGTLRTILRNIDLAPNDFSKAWQDH